MSKYFLKSVLALSFCFYSLSLFSSPLNHLIDYGLDNAIKKSFKAGLDNVTITLLEKRDDKDLDHPLLNSKRPLYYAAKYKRQKVLLHLLEHTSLKELTDDQKKEVFSIIIKNNLEDSFRSFINSPTFFPQDKWFNDYKKEWVHLIFQHTNLYTIFEKRMKKYFFSELVKPVSMLELIDAISDRTPLWLDIYLEMFDKSDSSGQALRDLILCDLASMTSSVFETKEKERAIKRFIESSKKVSVLPTFCGKYNKSLFELLGNSEDLMLSVLDHPSIKTRDINLNQDYLGSSIIHYYVNHNRNNLLKALIYHPLYLNHQPLYNPLIKDSLGETPLHTGVRHSNLYGVELLLLHPNVEKLHLETSPLNQSGKTPWELVSSQSSLDRVQVLEMIFNKTHLSCHDAVSCFPNLCTPIIKKGMAHLLNQELLSPMEDSEFREAIDKITPQSSSAVSIISFEESQNIFSLLKEEVILAFHQWDEGCYARAHYISLLLDQKFHLKSAKVFVTGPLSITNQKGRVVNWNYHVAPILYVVDPKSHKHEMRIFDVILGDRPLTLEEWKEKQSTNPLELKVTIVPAFVYGLGEFKKFKKLKETEQDHLNYLPTTTITMFSDLAEMLMSN